MKMEYLKKKIRVNYIYTNRRNGVAASIVYAIKKIIYRPYFSATREKSVV